MMDYNQNVSCLDGRTMIEMNNLAVGYFPSDAPQIGVYPPLNIEKYSTTTEGQQDLEKSF
jgi:hypothetical protein